MNTFRRFLSAQIARVVAQPDMPDYEEAARTLRIARNHALRLGLPEIAKLCHVTTPAIGVETARQILSEALALLPRATETAYLDSQQAADYLGISIKSLYGQVERGLIIPLRGPRRSYRFTKKMLDDSLQP